MLLEPDASIFNCLLAFTSASDEPERSSSVTSVERSKHLTSPDPLTCAEKLVAWPLMLILPLPDISAESLGKATSMQISPEPLTCRFNSWLPVMVLSPIISQAPETSMSLNTGAATYTIISLVACTL